LWKWPARTASKPIAPSARVSTTSVLVAEERRLAVAHQPAGERLVDDEDRAAGAALAGLA
jgi:hypothetical protein